MRFDNSHWHSEQLKDSFNLFKGNGLAKSDLSIEGKECILYGHLYTTYLSEIIDEVVYKTSSKLKNAMYSNENDVIIPASGETPEDIAKACCIKKAGVLLGGDLNILRTTLHDGAFTSYQLNSKRKYQIAKLAVGKTIVHLHNDDLKNLILYFPDSIQKEKKIATFLHLIDKRISTQKKIISNLESQMNSIKNKLFTKEYDSHTTALSSILNEISNKSIINNQFPVISSTVKGLVLQSEYFDKEIASSNNIGYKIIEKGNIILSPQNLWMGNITFNNKFDKGIVSPSYKVFNVDSKYNKEYIYEILTTKKAFYLYKTISEQGASIVRRNLNVEAFMHLSFKFPDINFQNKIMKYFSSFKNKLKNEKKILSLYEKQKQYLLNKMFI